MKKIVASKMKNVLQVTMNEENMKKLLAFVLKMNENPAGIQNNWKWTRAWHDPKKK